MFYKEKSFLSSCKEYLKISQHTFPSYTVLKSKISLLRNVSKNPLKYSRFQNLKYRGVNKMTRNLKALSTNRLQEMFQSFERRFNRTTIAAALLKVFIANICQFCIRPCLAVTHSDVTTGV